MADISLQQLLEAGCHFGHQSRRWNPAMADYIYTTRDKVHIFDLVKTKRGLDAALEIVKQLAAQEKKILFVGTKRQAQEIVTASAKRVNMPYVTERWLGGILTNFDQINKSLKKLKSLREEVAGTTNTKFTKREKLMKSREIARFERFLGGIEELEKIPDAMFVVDTHREEVAVKEAVRVGIPVIGLVDSNGNPDLVDYVIAANDDAVKSIELIVTAITDAVAKGLPKVDKKKPHESTA